MPAAAACVHLLREPAGAVEAAEQERVGVHDDVRLDRVHDVVDGLAELVGRVVVDEPVVRRRAPCRRRSRSRTRRGASCWRCSRGRRGRRSTSNVCRCWRSIGGSSVPASAFSRLAAPKAWSSTTIVMPLPSCPERCSASAPLSATPCEMMASAEDVSAISAVATAGERRTAASSALCSAALSRPPTQPSGMPPAETTARCASRAVSCGCHKHGSRDRGLGRASHRCGR